MARNPKTAAASSAGKPAQTALGWVPDAVPAQAMDVTRTAVGVSLSASRSLLKLMQQVQAGQSQLLADMDSALDAAIGESRQAAGLQELMALQANMLNAHAARAAQVLVSTFSRVADLQAEFLEQLQSQGATLAHVLIEKPDGAPAAGSADDASGNPSLALLGNAQAAWTQMTQQWIDAVKNGAVQH